MGRVDYIKNEHVCVKSKWVAKTSLQSLLQNSDQICRSDDEFDDKKGRNILK